MKEVTQCLQGFSLLQLISLNGITKGQLISKADWRAIDSPKKQICFVCFFTLHGKQIKFVRSFFGRIYGSSICFSIFSELYLVLYTVDKSSITG